MLVVLNNSQFYIDPITGIMKWDFGINESIDSYSRDKAKWVQFDAAKDKQKLRFYIRYKAEKLSSFTKIPYYQTKKLLVNSYNKGGLEGVKYAYQTTLIEILKNINNVK